ncbi:hypothetical protein GCM10027299_13330 [Larkinella ripae]
MRPLSIRSKTVLKCLLLLLIPILLLGRLTAFAQQSPRTVQQVRTAINVNPKRLQTPPTDVFKTEVRKIWSGTDSIPIQIYYPSARPNLPILYEVHAGAFILRMLDLNASRVNVIPRISNYAFYGARMVPPMGSDREHSFLIVPATTESIRSGFGPVMAPSEWSENESDRSILPVL